MKTGLTSLDEARAANPELSMTVYAYSGQPVTLEIITPDEQTYQFHGPSEAFVLAAAFPVRDEDQQEPTSIFD